MRVIQRAYSISSRIISPITRVISSVYHQIEFVDSLGFILIRPLMICKKISRMDQFGIIKRKNKIAVQWVKIMIAQ